MRKRTRLAEVVLAPCWHRIGKLTPTNPAFMWQIVFVRNCVFFIVRLFKVSSLKLLVHLPPVLVVRPVVHELTCVPEPTVSGLLVILTQHGFIIPSHGRSHVGRSSDRFNRHSFPDQRFLLVNILGVVVYPSVDLVVLLTLCLCCNLLWPLCNSPEIIKLIKRLST